MLEQKKKGFSETKTITIIGPEAEIIGEIRCKGAIRIEGAVSGKVVSDDTILVHENGVVKANLEAAQVIVAGAVEGDIAATERIEVATKAKLQGNITAPRISIADGVIFEGRCTMKPPKQSPAENKEQAQPPTP